MASPRLITNEEYWKNKGKGLTFNPITKKDTYRNVMLYFHDDMDGVYSAVLMKHILLKNNFNIIGYGVVNYQTGWSDTKLNPYLINICVDFSTYNEKLDVFIDHHHGVLDDKYKNRYAIKKSNVRGRDGEYSNKIGSCFELIAHLYGIAVPKEILDVIDMVDSAKYQHYGVDLKHCINYSKRNAINSDKPALVFAAMFNQLIKRADTLTMMEIVHNVSYPTIYNFYLKMVEFFPGNNCTSGSRIPAKAGEKDYFPYWIGRKDFFKDRLKAIEIMKAKTRGDSKRRFIFNTFEEFAEVTRMKSENEVYSIDGTGYVIIGRLVFVPTGSWANGIRLRALIEEDFASGYIPKNTIIDFMLLQYGNTLQLISYNNIDDIPIERMPHKYGKPIYNLGEYMDTLLHNCRQNRNYGFSETKVIEGDEAISTCSGGHIGIGTISNIKGTINGYRWLHAFKNIIIKDFSGVEWKNIHWNSSDSDTAKKDTFNKFAEASKLRTNGKQRSLYEYALESVTMRDDMEFKKEYINYYPTSKAQKHTVVGKLQDHLVGINDDFDRCDNYRVLFKKIDRKKEEY